MRMRILLIGLAVAVLPCTAAISAKGPQGKSAIEPKAEKYLKAMSNYLAGLKTFSFQVEESFDDVQDDGLKLQYSNQRKLTVSRPDRVYGESQGDTSNSNFYYDGKTVTVYDRTQKSYATVKAASTIDAMLDEMSQKYGVEQPLSDFLFSDPYKVLIEHVEAGAYVGLNHVGKTPCHHLVFRQKVLDWQIWIEEGEKTLPRKLVITFKRRSGEPQFVAYFHRWDVNPTVADDTFQFTPAAGTRKVDFLHRHGVPAEAKTPASK